MGRQRTFGVFRVGGGRSRQCRRKTKASATKFIRFPAKKRVFLLLEADEEVEVRSVLIRPVLSDSRNHN